jgi:hypothetical protein
MKLERKGKREKWVRLAVTSMRRLNDDDYVYLLHNFVRLGNMATFDVPKSKSFPSVVRNMGTDVMG